MAENIDIRVSSSSLQSFIDLRNTIRESRSAIVDLSNDEEVAKLAAKIGDARDKMKDVNEQVKIFTAGSDFEKVGNAYGAIKDDLLSMDFKGAAAKAKILNQTVSGISFKTATDGLKDLSSTFLALGKSLLTNPLFLLGGVAIAIGKIADELGLLKPIIDALNGAWDSIIGSIGSFTDAIGLTTIEADKNTKALQDNEKAALSLYETNQKSFIQDLEHQLALAKINGETEKATELTKQLTQAKQDLVEKGTVPQIQSERDSNEEIVKLRKRISEIKGALKDLREGKVFAIDVQGAREKLLNDLEETQQKLDKLSAPYDKRIEEARLEKKKISDAAIEEQAKADADAKKEEKKRQEEAEKKRLELQKQFNADMLSEERKAQDTRISLMSEGYDKELALLETKYSRARQDIESKYGKGTARAISLIGIVNQEEANEKIALNKKYNDEITKGIIQATQKRALELQKERENLIDFEKEKEILINQAADYELQKEDDKLQIFRNKQSDELADYKAYLQQKVQAKVYTDQQAAELEKFFRSTQATQEVDYVKQLARDKEAVRLQTELELKDLSLQRKIQDLNALRDLELQNTKLTEEERMKIIQDYEQKVSDLRKSRAKDVLSAISGGLNVASNSIEAVMALNDSIYQKQAADRAKAGIDEEAYARKNFETNKKLQIANAIVQGAQASLAAFSSAAAVPIVGPVLAPIAAAAAAVVALANIKRIKDTTYESPTVSTSSTSSSAASQPVFSFYGSGSNLGTRRAKSAQKGERPADQNINVTAVISETEVTATQERLANIRAHARLGR